MNTITNFNIFKITADDYGYCQQRNKGILEAASKGVVNSISVLVNGAAVERIAHTTHLKVGLHLNLSEGKPCSSSSNVSSLLTDEGFFFDKITIIKLVEEKSFVEEQISIEIEKQIKIFISIFEYAPDYIDGHQHVHILPMIRESLVKLMKKYSIIETRLPYELCLDDECNQIEESRMKFYKNVCKYAQDSQQYYQQHQIRFPRYFIGLTTMSRDFTIENISRALRHIQNDMKLKDIQPETRSIEIMTHPGYPSRKGFGGCASIGPDEFSCSEDRKHELNVLLSQDILLLFNEFLSKYKLEN